MYLPLNKNSDDVFGIWRDRENMEKGFLDVGYSN